MTSFIWKIVEILMSSITFFHKIQRAYDMFVGIFFFCEMTFVDIKSFVSIIANTKLYHWWNWPSQSSSTCFSKKRLFLLKPSFYKFLIFSGFWEKAFLLLLAIWSFKKFLKFLKETLEYWLFWFSLHLLSLSPFPPIG